MTHVSFTVQSVLHSSVCTNRRAGLLGSDPSLEACAQEGLLENTKAHSETLTKMNRTT